MKLFLGPPSSTPMKPQTRQIEIFVELILQLKMALDGFNLLSITIDHYLQKKSLSLSLSVKISLSLILGKMFCLNYCLQNYSARDHFFSALLYSPDIAS